ncbi:valyl-tRNA synthetase [Verrucomicrobium sp. GAS474]|uniref:valine--tRNA ligase n=1 Tax=Verrucomicrobium sp. GAS474 TaxID=1882831 RepID=UPI00087C30F1|nr:valine--tRNA ligase [Verrucomicrobium sp. GAS474]SDT97956.1 valyl-tRNA synthetase [Verrucomicrobium sp. GAS474]
MSLPESPASAPEPDLELAKAYEPGPIQDRLYAAWLAKGYYHADPASPKEGYSIVIPPPNITGILHLGHVLNNTIQDILCRKARMEGKEVLWLPGTDHAGLATQTVVEKHLRKEEKITRHDLGREAFLQRVWSWKEDRGGIIIAQLKKLGVSCDWDRTRFTLDAAYTRAVQDVFVALYKKGLIRRGKRMVNWCPGSLTAISDEEVIPKPQKSKLYHIRYEIVDAPGTFLTVATTRPETIPGDTALAVHPDDPRYAALVGKTAYRPFPKEALPIVGDAHIDPKFGTGVLKVTPAHDKADFEIGARHHLPTRDILTPDGKIACPEVPELHGLDRFEARTKAAALLAELGLLDKEEDYQNTVGFSERADVPIEPRLSEQWFLDYPQTEEALRVVREKLIRFFPEHWEKVYNHWLENIQPWCISRQVWWGHRIPVWYKPGAEPLCQVESPGAEWEQDPDTLDTWFSSWLWAYETMDVADGTRKKFYPTNVLVTGPDIIFLWVARMIVAGLEFQPGKDASAEANIPFRDVYFTGLIRDKQGRKMSKSLGNSPDPLDLIASYGADGVRFGLVRIAPQGQDIRFDEKQIEEGRNFGNKLWNACRFRAMQGKIDPQADPSRLALSPFAAALLESLHATIAKVNAALDAYEFSVAAGALYDFVWNDFCSRFIEAAKVDFLDAASPTRAGTLAATDYTLSRVLRLLHPYMPFLTEELWLNLGFGTGTIQFAAWPKGEAAPTYPTAVVARHGYETAEKGRSLRSQFGLPSNKKVPFLITGGASITGPIRRELETLLNAEMIEFVDVAPERTPSILTPLGELCLPLAGLIDPEAERARIGKELAKIEKDLALTEGKLANTEVVSRAPEAKVNEWRTLLETLKAGRERLGEQLKQLESL